MLGKASRFHQPDGGPPLDFINIQPSKRGPASRFHQHTAPKRGSASRTHQHTAPNQPKMVVRQQGQFLWILRYKDKLVIFHLVTNLVHYNQF
mgnify:CR=1 FL=1